MAVAVSFIDAINHGDLARLTQLMTPDHEMTVFDEPMLVGSEACVEAWRSYMERYPNYVIYPRRITESSGRVAILGHTTGSHVDLLDAIESTLTLIWVAGVVDGGVRVWQILPDRDDHRVLLDLFD